MSFSHSFPNENQDSFLLRKQLEKYMYDLIGHLQDMRLSNYLTRQNLGIHHRSITALNNSFAQICTASQMIPSKLPSTELNPLSLTPYITLMTDLKSKPAINDNIQCMKIIGDIEKLIHAYLSRKQLNEYMLDLIGHLQDMRANNYSQRQHAGIHHPFVAALNDSFLQICSASDMILYPLPSELNHSSLTPYLTVMTDLKKKAVVKNSTACMQAIDKIEKFIHTYLSTLDLSNNKQEIPLAPNTLQRNSLLGAPNPHQINNALHSPPTNVLRT